MRKQKEKDDGLVYGVRHLESALDGPFTSTSPEVREVLNAMLRGMGSKITVEVFSSMKAFQKVQEQSGPWYYFYNNAFGCIGISSPYSDTSTATAHARNTGFAVLKADTLMQYREIVAKQRWAYMTKDKGYSDSFGSKEEALTAGAKAMGCSKQTVVVWAFRSEDDFQELRPQSVFGIARSGMPLMVGPYFSFQAAEKKATKNGDRIRVYPNLRAFLDVNTVPKQEGN